MDGRGQRDDGTKARDDTKDRGSKVTVMGPIGTAGTQDKSRQVRKHCIIYNTLTEINLNDALSSKVMNVCVGVNEQGCYATNMKF